MFTHGRWRYHSANKAHKTSQAFFSMSVFSFEPQEGPQVVSSWIWLYFVVTLALMAVVFGIWRIFTRRSNRDYKQLLVDTAAAGRR